MMWVVEEEVELAQFGEKTPRPDLPQSWVRERQENKESCMSGDLEQYKSMKALKDIQIKASSQLYKH